MEVHDGAFQQISGRLLDRGVMTALEKKKAAIDEVTQTLGPPQERVSKDAVTEILGYASVRARTSYQTTFGIKYGESTQTFSERWQLTFTSGRLSETIYSSETK
jgi:hypothetical protein